MLPKGHAPGLDEVFRGLDRHQQRRNARIPTVSLLVGPEKMGIEVCQRWAESRGGSVVLVDTPDPHRAVRAWLEQFDKDCNLRSKAGDWLAARTGLSSESIRRKTGFELDLIFESEAVPSPCDVRALCRLLYLRDESAGAWLEGIDWDPVRLLTAMRPLLCAGAEPIMLLRGCPALPEGLTWLESAARMLSDLASADSLLTLVSAIESPVFDAYQERSPASRAKAILSATVIAVDPLASGLENDRVDEFFPEHAPTEHTSSATSSTDDEARSAAERFLFDRLEEGAETTGLFELNRTIEVRFGSARDLEIDLLAPSLKLAVEIDGYYHFQDPDAYRRDRRKDLELQKQGFLVLRFLADDVVERLEEILATIRDAVAHLRMPS